MLGAVSVSCIALGLAGCGGSNKSDVCSNGDRSLTSSAFVFVVSPASGERVSSGFHVNGCSNTFEATLNWTLHARNGSKLASGVAQGGTLESGSFNFAVDYSVTQLQVGDLEVVGGSGTSTEGFPPPKDVVPLVLQP